MQAVVNPAGTLVFRNQIIRVALGAQGVRRWKQERDEATPAGILPLRRVLYRADRGPPPACAVPIEPIGRNDGWCDDPYHRDYNRMVRLPHDGRHEQLWRNDPIYDIVGVLGWNDDPVVRNAGSAIFLHIAGPHYAPTQGCVALAPADLRALLAAGLTELLIQET